MTSPLFLFRPSVRDDMVVCSTGFISVRSGTENLCRFMVARMPGSSRRRARNFKLRSGLGRYGRGRSLWKVYWVEADVTCWERREVGFAGVIGEEEMLRGRRELVDDEMEF